MVGRTASAISWRSLLVGRLHRQFPSELRLGGDYDREWACGPLRSLCTGASLAFRSPPSRKLDQGGAGRHRRASFRWHTWVRRRDTGIELTAFRSNGNANREMKTIGHLRPGARAGGPDPHLARPERRSAGSLGGWKVQPMCRDEDQSAAHLEWSPPGPVFLLWRHRRDRRPGGQLPSPADDRPRCERLRPRSRFEPGSSALRACRQVARPAPKGRRPALECGAQDRLYVPSSGSPRLGAKFGHGFGAMPRRVPSRTEHLSTRPTGWRAPPALSSETNLVGRTFLTFRVIFHLDNVS